MMSKFFDSFAKFQWFDYVLLIGVLIYFFLVVIGIFSNLTFYWKKKVSKTVTIEQEMERDLQMIRGNEAGLIITIVFVFCLAILCRHL